MFSEKPPLKTLQTDIKKLLEKGVDEEIFPCAAAGISWGLGKNRREIITYFGNASLYPEERKLHKNNFFDIASLTKPLATTMAILCLIKEKKIGIDDTLPSLVEKKIPGEKSLITLKHLLSHSSGLPAHRDYYYILKNLPCIDKQKYVEDLILREPLVGKPGITSLYSDLGFMLLGRIIEIKTGKCLSHYVEEKVLKPFNLEKNIFYKPLFEEKKLLTKNDFVATENCPWRQKVLLGEVHDDNCYSMGGVAGHSGLFGNISGVTTYAGLILAMWKGDVEHPNIKKSDFENFCSTPHKTSESSWALGFDRPSMESSSGRYLSKKSIGHLGFTGSSFWIDPVKEIAIVLLSNRVHPSSKNLKIKLFRPYFHDRIIKIIFSNV